MIDSKFLHTEAYIDAQCKGSYKKKTKSEGYYRGRMEKNQKQKQTRCSVKSRNGQQEGIVAEEAGTVLAGTNSVGALISAQKVQF